MANVPFVLFILLLIAAASPSVVALLAKSHVDSTTISFIVHPLQYITHRPRRRRRRSDSPWQIGSSHNLDSSIDSIRSMSPTLWFQHSITITAPHRGCHLITNDVVNKIQGDLSQIQMGMCHLFLQHTSASLSINENADPDVRVDMETAMNRIVPATWTNDGTFRHTDEGEDDMPGHVKSSLLGVSLAIPISQGRLALGTWQGIYLNEHRNQGGWGNGHQRTILITLQGLGKE